MEIDLSDAKKDLEYSSDLPLTPINRTNDDDDLSLNLQNFVEEFDKMNIQMNEQPL